MSGRSRQLPLVAVWSLLCLNGDPGIAQTKVTHPTSIQSRQAEPGPGRSDAGDTERLFEEAVKTQIAAAKAGGEERAALQREAIEHYQKVLELRPNAAAAMYNLGRAQQALGDRRAAARSFEQAASRPGANRIFYLEKWGDFLREEGDWDEASRAYEELVLLEPRSEGIYGVLRGRYVEAGDDHPEWLLDYAWKLIADRQGTHAADLALSALEAGWSPGNQPELLTLVACGLAIVYRSRAEMVESPLLSRLRPFVDAGAIGPGVRELLDLFFYQADRSKVPSLDWWSSGLQEPPRPGAMSRHEAIQAVLRAVGDGFREVEAIGPASRYYRAAIEVGGPPDAVALRSLAILMAERNDLPALSALAIGFADPGQRFFQENNLAYQRGEVEKSLDYHRALGFIYGAMAADDQADWGSLGRPDSALFQLELAYETAQLIDERGARPGDPQGTQIDPGLTLLYARGLEATGEPSRAFEVRFESARRFRDVGDRGAEKKVLESIDIERLTADEIQMLDETFPDLVEVPNNASAALLDCPTYATAGKPLCACGRFPTETAMAGVRLDGEALRLLEGTPGRLLLQLPDTLEPGEHTLRGDPEAGFGAEAVCSFQMLRLSGSIDQKKLFRGQGADLEISVEGTRDPVRVRLFNGSPQVVRLKGGDEQVATSKGGRKNRIRRNVRGLEKGAFQIDWTLLGTECPCN